MNERAACEARHDQWKENRLLAGLETSNGVVSGDECRGILQCGALRLEGVCQRNRKILDQCTSLGVPRIDHAGDVVVREQDVLVVRITVKHAHRTCRQFRQCDRAIQVHATFEHRSQ